MRPLHLFTLRDNQFQYFGAYRGLHTNARAGEHMQLLAALANQQSFGSS